MVKDKSLKRLKIKQLCTIIVLFLLSRVALAASIEPLQDFRKKEKMIPFINSIMGTYQISNESLQGHALEKHDFQNYFLRIYLRNNKSDSSTIKDILDEESFDEAYLTFELIYNDVFSSRIFLEHIFEIKLVSGMKNLSMEEPPWPDEDPGRINKVYPYEIVREGVDPLRQTLFRTIKDTRFDKKGPRLRRRFFKKIQYHESGSLDLVVEDNYFSPTQRRLRGKLKKWITGDSGGWEPHPKYSNSMRRISAKKIGPVLSISKIAAQSGIQIKESDQREFLFMESLQGQKRFIYSNGNQVEAAEYFRQNNKNAIEFIKNNPPLRGADFYTWFDSFLFNFHRTAHTEPNGNIVDGETSVLGVLPSGAILFLAESNPELQWVKKVETSLNRILKKQILNEQSWPAQLVKTEIFSAAIRMFYLQKYAEKVDGGMESNMILYHFSIFSKALEQFGFKERRTMILYQILDVFEKHYPLDFTVWKQELRELLIKMNPRAASSQSLLNAVDNYPLKMSNTCSDILSNP